LGDEGTERLANDCFKMWGNPVESSDAHASSSAALSEPGVDGCGACAAAAETSVINSESETAEGTVESFVDRLLGVLGRRRRLVV
jgi:hypothetical protein